jgi:hypothetical protein
LDVLVGGQPLLAAAAIGQLPEEVLRTFFV